MRITFMYAGHQYAIKFDGLQFIAYKNEVSDNGRERNGVLGYFKQFGAAIEKIIKLDLGSKEDEVTIREFVERYEAAVREVRSIQESEF